MTSQQRQPPRRPLTVTNSTQPSSSHRSLSQQYHLSSPAARRSNDNFVDLTLEDTEAVHGQYGAVPKHGSSRLRSEFFQDSRGPGLVESPKPTSEKDASLEADAGSDVRVLTDAANTPDSKGGSKGMLDVKASSDASRTTRILPIHRGRPLLWFDAPKPGGISPAATEEPSKEAPPRPLPLPARPGRHLPPPNDDKARHASSSVAKKDGRPKPYSLTAPSIAPVYANSSVADFFPWTGNHPEDQFSDAIIRHGFLEKNTLAQNETGTAKGSIFPALKQKSSLQTISSLLTNILTQRRTHGKITSPSTFKPPPRVTVTDAKRELWLKNLANPDIALRRLNRSIPHGIRGKVLLEQSLSKNIPIARAVWLAKCVGANELRAFRRKGVTGRLAIGGEAKWIRDFTICVEQFLESAVGSCGEADFKQKINYAIRLATHFYAEHLLDLDHYLDWVVSTVENSSQAKLPLWILVAQIYWKEIFQLRKYGRRMAAALLKHFCETLNQIDSDLLSPLTDRLKLMLQDLIILHPDSFVSSKIWVKYSPLILSNFSSESPQLASMVASIDARNRRFPSLITKKEATTRQQLIQLLDQALSQPIGSEFVKQLWDMDESKDILVHTIIQWSTSCHRSGSTKVFLSTRILRAWSRFGVGVTEAVLNFLDAKVCQKGRCKLAVYHLVSELTRSGHFSAPKYMQWLIARGGMYTAADVSKDGPCATRLLAELPVHELTDGMARLRQTLLSRAGFSVEDEEQCTSALMSSISRSLPGMQADVTGGLEVNGSPMSMDGDDHLADASRTIKSEIGLWLRQKVRLQMIQPTIPPLDDWDASIMKGGTSAITASDFYTVRTYFEEMDDYSMLADTLKIVSSSNDVDVLASCVDTLNLHAETFAAIGALKGLFDIFLARLRSVAEAQDMIPRVLLVALMDLATRIPDHQALAHQLAQDLLRSDRKTAADACSPVSDHMQIAEADFTTEFDKILASGNSMDKATLERLFQRVILRVEDSWGKSSKQVMACGQLLTRLRTFDTENFDILMAAWVYRFKQLKSRPSMVEVFGPLISFGCLSVKMAIAEGGAKPKSDDLRHNETDIRIVREALELLISPLILAEDMRADSYRFRIKQKQFQKDYPLETLSVIRGALYQLRSPTKSQVPDDIAAITRLISSVEIHELLRSLVLADIDSTCKALTSAMPKGEDTEGSKIIERIIDRLLIPENDRDVTETISIRHVLESANDLTLSFCRLKLASMFGAGDDNSASDITRNERLDVLDESIASAVASGDTTWVVIVPLLGVPIARHLRQRAEAQFFSLFQSLRSTTGDDGGSLNNRVVLGENMLRIIDAAAYSIPTAGSANASTAGPDLPADMVKVLNKIWLLSSSGTPEMKTVALTRWLPLILSFISIHTNSLSQSKRGLEQRAKAIYSLSTVYLELQALDTHTEETVAIMERTYDLAMHLVDELPDDIRQVCIRGMRDTINKPQISYLLSYATNPTDWLVWRRKVKQGMTSDPASSNKASTAPPVTTKEKVVPFPLRRWEMLSDPTPNMSENDTSLTLTLFGAGRK
ncbi:RNA polymerase-like protein II mediator complex component Srb8 [Xylogone sp. PMI_703]|nr:RNA polymerase-like protein II mediator complex component Srb8 [Xylogone sp. PMI_703]